MEVNKIMEPKRITADQVKLIMDSGEKIVFLDARNAVAWSKADTKLPGAIRVPAGEAEQHLNEIPQDCLIVAYCT